MSLSACGGSGAEGDRQHGGRLPNRAAGPPAATAEPPAPVDRGRIPGVGDHLYRRIPDGSRQALVVYGDGRESPDSTIVYYVKDGDAWSEVDRWAGHNGREGWTTDHYEGDLRSPVGVFTLSDAGGVRDDPGATLPYDQNSVSYAVPANWGEAHRSDFDYVIAIDYNRRPGTPPSDPIRPGGSDRGGGIWLHVDHGDGTAACITLPESGMEYLLQTLDPDRRPVVVMGDRANLRA
ncbi:hypothetical protein ACWDA7_16610 [Streptomyces sp. NPDC001156]